MIFEHIIFFPETGKVCLSATEPYRQKQQERNNKIRKKQEKEEDSPQPIR
tara:strand:- start:7051 stop:7200 length:150 start_codon:yes stop_codon:yes gene_type:complete